MGWLVPATGIVPERGAGGFEITVRIEGDYWWQPLSRRRGNELADELVRKVIEAWDRRNG